jgi:S-(hydroxymethyl)glutathione dehydrogenase / alcohol dehydrogenase
VPKTVPPRRVAYSLHVRVQAAVCFESGKRLTVRDVELKPAGADEVTVQVKACGVCHSDVSFMDGEWYDELPAVYGHEVAGIVAKVGAGVDSVALGDHVVVTLIRSCGECFYCLRGQVTQCEGAFAIDEAGALHLPDGRIVKQGLRVAGFAESVTVHKSQVVRIPHDVPLDSACLLACAVATGYGAVHNDARILPGASVAVVGVGGVGLNAVQGARLAGADPLIAIDVSDSRLGSAAQFGAEYRINSRTQDAGSLVRRLTSGHGTDYTFVAAGAASAVELGMELTRRGGTIVIIGMPPAGATVVFDPGAIADHGIRVIGSKLGSTHPQVDVPAMVELYRNGRLKLDELVTGRFPLSRINEAVSLARDGAGVREVIVF